VAGPSADAGDAGASADDDVEIVEEEVPAAVAGPSADAGDAGASADDDVEIVEEEVPAAEPDPSASASDPAKRQRRFVQPRLFGGYSKEAGIPIDRAAKRAKTKESKEEAKRMVSKQATLMKRLFFRGASTNGTPADTSDGASGSGTTGTQAVTSDVAGGSGTNPPVQNSPVQNPPVYTASQKAKGKFPAQQQ
jgi:hypothetical protein